MRVVKTVVQFAGNNRDKLRKIKKTHVRINGRFNLSTLIDDPDLWGCDSDAICGRCDHSAPWISGIAGKKFDYGMDATFETQGDIPLGIVRALLDPVTNPSGYCRCVTCIDVATGEILVDARCLDEVRDESPTPPRLFLLQLSEAPTRRASPFGRISTEASISVAPAPIHSFTGG